MPGPIRPAVFRDAPMDPRVAGWTIQALSRLLAVYAVLQGLNLIVGGQGRFSASHFAVAALLPYAPASWGTMLTSFGSLALVGSLVNRLWMVRLGHFLSAVWCIFFAITFVLAAMRVPTAATSVIFSYGCLSVAYLLVVGGYRYPDQP